MTSTPPKSNLATVSTFEIDDSAHAQSPRPGSGQASTLVDSPSPSRILDTARLAITIVALLLSVAIIGVSADNLKTYKDTSLSREYELPLWPYDFNRGPTEALIACASIIAVSSIVAVLGAKVSKIRDTPSLHRLVVFLTSALGLLSSIIGISFFYGINSSSTTATIHSWSCHWRDLSAEALGMSDAAIKPDFGHVCQLAEAGLYSMVVMVPLWFVVGVLGLMGVARERTQMKVARGEEEGKY